MDLEAQRLPGAVALYPFLGADYERLRDDEVRRLGDGLGHLADAVHILDSLVLNDEFIDFLTLPAYGHLD